MTEELNVRMGIRENIKSKNRDRKHIKNLKKFCKQKGGEWKTVNSGGTASCEFDGKSVEYHREEGVLQVKDGGGKRARHIDDVEISEKSISIDGKSV